MGIRIRNRKRMKEECFLPIIILASVLYFVAWIINMIKCLIDENKKSRKLKEYHLSLGKEELSNIYAGMATSTWRNAFMNKTTIVIVALVIIFFIILIFSGWV